VPLKSWTFGRLALSQSACRSHSSRCRSGLPWSSVYLASMAARARQPRTVHCAEYPQVNIWISAATIADPNETAIKRKGRPIVGNSGILFKNDSKRETRDRDYQGTADVTCAHCGSRFHVWLSAYIKEGRKGIFQALSFKAKEPDSQSPTPREEDLAF
jgi:hypothetical protein